MGLFKSHLALTLSALYLAIAVIALIHDLTRKPSVVLIFDKISPLVVFPGLFVTAIPLELIGVNIDSGTAKWLLLIASSVVTAIMVFLLVVGIEALYKAVIR